MRLCKTTIFKKKKLFTNRSFPSFPQAKSGKSLESLGVLHNSNRVFHRLCGKPKGKLCRQSAQKIRLKSAKEEHLFDEKTRKNEKAFVFS
jgi:hypothetical protein